MKNDGLFYNNKNSEELSKIVHIMIRDHIYPFQIQTLFEIRLKRIHNYTKNYKSIIEDFFQLSQICEILQDKIEVISFFNIF